MLNKSLVGSTSQIGIASVQVKQVLPRYGEDTNVTIDLVHNSGKGKGSQQGQVVMMGHLEPIADPVKARELPPQEKWSGSYRLKLTSLRAHDLANTGGMLDKQDPCMKLTVGKDSRTTER